MPAARSRTENWRDSVRKLLDRNGALEISIENPVAADAADGNAALPAPTGADVVWRVKVLSCDDSSITVEQPSAFGSNIRLEPGVAIIGAITIGQNRWMFRSRTLPARPGHSSFPGVNASGQLILSAPEGVERCTRRSFYRISTVGLRLPNVACWPLLDPASVVAAEAANRLQIRESATRGPQSAPAPSDLANEGLDSLLLPIVGPRFPASLINVSGGGLGLLVAREDAQAAQNRPHLWLRVDLRPQIAAPIAVTVRLAHTHMDSTQNLYAGVAFDFTHGAEHKKFVVDLFAQYVDELQRRQRVGQLTAA